MVWFRFSNLFSIVAVCAVAPICAAANPPIEKVACKLFGPTQSGYRTVLSVKATLPSPQLKIVRRNEEKEGCREQTLLTKKKTSNDNKVELRVTAFACGKGPIYWNAFVVSAYLYPITKQLGLYFSSKSDARVYIGEESTDKKFDIELGGSRYQFLYLDCGPR